MSVPKSKKNKGGRRIVSTRATKGKKKRAMQVRGRERVVSAPVSRATIGGSTSSVRYGAAPYEETYGNGLRVSGTLCSVPVTREASGGSLNKIFQGQASSSATYSATALSSVMSYTQLSPYVASMWRNGTAANLPPVSRLIGMHSKFALRKLVVRFVSTVSTSYTGSLVLAVVFERGLDSALEENSFQTISGLAKSARGSLWSRFTLVAINDTDLSRPAARLYDTDPNYTVAAGFLGQEQCKIIGAVDALPSQADTIGYLEFEFVADCYQLRGAQQALIGLTEGPEGLAKLEAERKAVATVEAKEVKTDARRAAEAALRERIVAQNVTQSASTSSVSDGLAPVKLDENYLLVKRPKA